VEHPPGPLLDVGRVVKPHGVRGEVVVELWTNRTERLDPGTVLLTRDGRPLSVASARSHQGRYLVWLEDVGTLEAAEALRGEVLQAAEIKDPEVIWVHELLEAEVVTGDGRTIGTVRSVEANPASDLMVLSSGHLVPLTFVRELVRPGDGTRQVVVDLPAGLVD
jgi:16S rRNA processing protein RimM